MEEKQFVETENAKTVLAGKSKLRAFILGIFIGLAVIAPGISGSTVAIILGLYAAMLYAMGHLISKEYKECFLFLLPLGIGAVIGFLGGFLVVREFFGAYVFETVALFTGLMTGALPALTREIRSARMTGKRVLLLGIGILLPIAIALLSFYLLPEEGSGSAFSDFPVWRFLVYLPLGVLVSLTQIVPGLSATAILMATGQFSPILESVHLDYILANPIVLLLYFSLGVGFLAGLLGLSRILSYLLARYHDSAFCLITGLSVGSIVSMYLGTDMMHRYGELAALSAFPWGTVVLGVLLFAFGFVLAYLLVRYEEKHGIKAS